MPCILLMGLEVCLNDDEISLDMGSDLVDGNNVFYHINAGHG